jgi:hypothetical protein
MEAGLRVDIKAVSRISVLSYLASPMARVYSLSGTLSGLVYANQFYGTSPSGTKMSVFDYFLEEDIRLRLTQSFP